MLFHNHVRSDSTGSSLSIRSVPQVQNSATSDVDFEGRAPHDRVLHGSQGPKFKSVRKLVKSKKMMIVWFLLFVDLHGDRD